MITCVNFNSISGKDFHGNKIKVELARASAGAAAFMGKGGSSGGGGGGRGKTYSDEGEYHSYHGA